MSEAQPVSAKIRTALSHFLHTSPKDIDDAVLDHITSFTDRALLARFVKDFVCDVEEADVAAFVDLVLPASNLLSDTNSLKRPGTNDSKPHNPCGTASSDTREIFIPSSSREEEPELLGNCIQCGKIAFGTGTEKWSDVACSFCGNAIAAVSSFHPLQTADATSSTEETLSPTALAALEEAIKRKNVLLEFQRTAAERTRIYDDATDWYRESANTWISEDERQKALCLANEHELQKRNRARMVALDFANQRVLECPQETPNSTFYDLRRSHIVFDSNAPKLTSSFKESTRNSCVLSSSPQPPAHLKGASLDLYQELQQDLFQNHFLTPTASKDPETSQKAIYEEEEEKHELASFCNDSNVLNENAHDEGVCLTLHQPYASLLVRGIKRMEGRSWATAHRGRLWIHAAQRVPPPEEIVRVETEYSALYKTSDGSRLPCPFPTSYPTSALLGCVTLTDCLSQDEYQAAYRQKCEQNQCCVYEPNASPYIFVCEAPRQLAVPVHMSGNHKLWALPKQRIRSLQCALFRA